MAVAALNAPAWAAQKNAPEAHQATEVLTCRNGTEDRHARIAVVLVGGKADSFAYYSKWKPRTCSIYLQRKHDAFSHWRDKGAVTMVDTDRGAFLIEHGPLLRALQRDIGVSPCLAQPTAPSVPAPHDPGVRMGSRAFRATRSGYSPRPR